MRVSELIEKLKTCPQDAVVCWDAHGMDAWFGSTFTVETASTRNLRESLEVESHEDAEHIIPDGVTQVVTLS